MKNLLLFALIISFAACSSTDDPAPTPQPNTNTFQQDARFLGNWRADSLWDSASATTYPGRGIQGIEDSIIISPPSYNGNTPVAELQSWFVSGSTAVDLPDNFFWETKGDSLFVFVGGHAYAYLRDGYQYGYMINGNTLRLEMRHTFLTGPSYTIGYYHKN